MIRRVLVVQPYGIGDLLFITPVLRALRLIPTVEKVDLLLGSRTQEVIQANPHINDITILDKDKMHARSFSENLQFLKKIGKELKKNRYDLLLDYSIRGEYAFWGQFFLGIPKRAGYSYKNRAFFHNVCVAIPDGFQGRHAVDFACDLAEAAGVSVQNRFIEFFFSEKEQAALEKNENLKIPEGSIAVALGGGESWGKDAHLKRWPTARFAELARYFLEKKAAAKIFLIGSAGEKELAAEFLKFAKKLSLPAEDFTGKLSLTETAWLLKKSKFFVGNDGGLLHLARAVFKPVVGIYGPADPQVYGPYPIGENSVTVYQPPANGKPRYFKFRYDPNDRSLQDLSVTDAITIIEKSNLSVIPAEAGI